jgi:intracellular sulfur oxidation DsrE/DsrF family protein
MAEVTPLVRRSFLGRLAAAGTAVGAALAGGAVLPTLARAEPHLAQGHPEDAWLDALKGMHKNIYDCTSAEGGGMGWFYANNFVTANTGAPYNMKASQLSVIVSVRHFATIFGYNDAMWAKYPFGELFKVNDEATKAPSKKNPNTKPANDLAKSGVITAVCGMATAYFAGNILAAKMGLKAADIEAELRANLVSPTARMVVAGVVATNRAQEKGFAYNYVG